MVVPSGPRVKARDCDSMGLDDSRVSMSNNDSRCVVDAVWDAMQTRPGQKCEDAKNPESRSRFGAKKLRRCRSLGEQAGRGADRVGRCK